MSTSNRTPLAAFHQDTPSEKRWLAVITLTEELQRFDEVSASDVTEVVETLKEYPSSQFLRRTVIRNFAAHVDGEIYMMKQVTLALSRVRKVDPSFSRNDLALLAEEKTYLDEAGQEQKLIFPRFLKNFKFAFKSYARVNGFTLTLDCNDERYGHFLEMVRVRDRLMHPKSLRDFYIEDEEFVHIGKAWTWYHQQAARLLSIPGDPSGLRTKFSPVEDPS